MSTLRDDENESPRARATDDLIAIHEAIEVGDDARSALSNLVLYITAIERVLDRNPSLWKEVVVRGR